ncbi:maleylpyruvate isomerase family mycothiol-dependent enzyme [Nocardia sp. NPDC049149]|uniref:maleylpyruvate isomerase family mycothiol-dependent enzyme n=1 Tax=Nocardia sp. NPDC049149 TaxID=3364315 RepID=UPI003710CB8E
MGTSLAELLAQERAELIELLRTVTGDEWEQPSLCAGWRVRDVLGHMLNGTVPLPIYSAVLVRSGFSVDRCNARLVRRTADLPPGVMVDRFASTVGWIARMSPVLALSSLFVHQQDIRRPLGRERQIPTERMLAVLDHPDPFAKPKRYTQGLRMVATDVDWASGAGPEVRGPGEAIVLAMVGRGAAVNDLHGDGITTLRERCRAVD